MRLFWNSLFDSGALGACGTVALPWSRQFSLFTSFCLYFNLLWEGPNITLVGVAVQIQSNLSTCLLKPVWLGFLHPALMIQTPHGHLGSVRVTRISTPTRFPPFCPVVLTVSKDTGRLAPKKKRQSRFQPRETGGQVVWSARTGRRDS